METVALRSRLPAGLLRRTLLADAVVCGSAGILLTLAAGPLADQLDLPTSLLRIAGIGLLPWTAIVLSVATRASIRRRGVWVIIGVNALWAAASLLLLGTGWVDPSSLGVAFIVTQALIVTAFASVQTFGLRQAA